MLSFYIETGCYEEKKKKIINTISPFHSARTLQRPFNAREIQALCAFTALEKF